LGEEEDVAAQPPQDRRIGADRLTNEVDRLVSGGAKQVAPVIGKLLVDVMVPSLEWNRRGEQDHPRMVGQRLHELRRRRGAQVFGNLEADHQIEGSSEIEFSLQIERGDQVLRDLRQLPVRPVSFYAQAVV